jgi:uncharacterized membrane protein
MHHKNRDLLLAMLIAFLNVGWALLPDRSPVIGIIIVLPQIFVLPGYTLTAILSHRPSPEVLANRLLLKPGLLIEKPFDIPERLILTLGLSLAIDILCGFILNMFPIGLRALSWAVFLGLLTSIFALFAAYLRHGVQNSKRQTPRFRITIYEYILLALAIMIVILSVQYSAVSAEQQPRPGFTQLWVIQSDQTKHTCAVSLGVRSFESTAKRYSVTLTVNGNPVNTWPIVTLDIQQEWSKQVSLKSEIAENISVEVRLYWADKPGILYRDVHLTLHSLKGANNGLEQQCTI